MHKEETYSRFTVFMLEFDSVELSRRDKQWLKYIRLKVRHSLSKSCTVLYILTYCLHCKNFYLMISVFFRKRIADSISFRAAMRMIPLFIPHILHLNQPLSAAIYRSFSSLNFLYFLKSSHTRSSIFHHCLSTYAGYLQVPLSTDMNQSSACSSISSSHTSYQTAKKLLNSLPLQKIHVAISILRCVFQHGYLWIKNSVSNNIWYVQQLVAIPWNMK